MIKQRTKHIISLECRKSWLTECQDALKYSWGGWLKPWTRLNWNSNKNPLPSYAFSFYTLSMLTKIVIWNPLYHQDISRQWSDDVMISFGESLHMHLVNWVGIVTLSRDAKADALLNPFYEWGNGSLRCKLWHSPPGISTCPCIESARVSM